MCPADIRRDDLTGFCLGPYDLGPKIGGGGMGKVFRARHRCLERDLAVKFVAADIACHPDAQRRFELETRALGKLQHPQIVNAVDAGSVHGVWYLVTEWVDGEDLARLVSRRGPLPMAEACELMRQTAIGLAHSHTAGFVHRDIKPSNLIVDRTGTVKILDFGLVHSRHADQALTEVGTALGTWDFMAPEQAHDSRQVDHRCDLYGLGCTLLFLLSGRAPFEGDGYASPAAKIRGHLFDAPPWLACPPANVPAELLGVLRRLLEKSPAERHQSAQEVAEALTPFAQSTSAAPRTTESQSKRSQPKGARSPRPNPSSRRKRWTTSVAAAGVVATCLVATVGLIYWTAGTAPVAHGAAAESTVSAPAEVASAETAPATPVTAAFQPTKSVSPPRFVISRSTPAHEPPASAESAPGNRP